MSEQHGGKVHMTGAEIRAIVGEKPTLESVGRCAGELADRIEAAGVEPEAIAICEHGVTVFGTGNASNAAKGNPRRYAANFDAAFGRGGKVAEA